MGNTQSPVNLTRTHLWFRHPAHELCLWLWETFATDIDSWQGRGRQANKAINDGQRYVSYSLPYDRISIQLIFPATLRLTRVCYWPLIIILARLNAIFAAHFPCEQQRLS